MFCLRNPVPPWSCSLLYFLFKIFKFCLSYLIYLGSIFCIWCEVGIPFGFPHMVNQRYQHFLLNSPCYLPWSVVPCTPGLLLGSTPFPQSVVCCWARTTLSQWLQLSNNPCCWITLVPFPFTHTKLFGYFSVWQTHFPGGKRKRRGTKRKRRTAADFYIPSNMLRIWPILSHLNHNNSAE